MKISSIQGNNKINAYSNQKQQFKSGTVNKTYKDTVTISEDGKYLSKVNAGSEDMDLDKINEIKSRIKQGTYTVNSRNIAKKILGNIKGE